jgi:hypothetical protein
VIRQAGAVELLLEAWAAPVGLAEVGDEGVDGGGVFRTTSGAPPVTARRNAGLATGARLPSWRKGCLRLAAGRREEFG